MWNATSLWILLSIAGFGFVHTLLADPRVKDWIALRLGRPRMRLYRLGYNLFSVLSLAPALALTAWLPDVPLYTIPTPWVVLTVSAQVLAAAALAAGVLQTGALAFAGIRQLFDPTAPEEGRLVTRGVYRWVRHPLYSAGMVFMWCSPVMTRNLFLLYLGFSLYFLIGAWFEERKLLKLFGPDYAAYRQRTPMFIPGLRRSPSA
jgi:protein-S-isoprenylcysteine O-methyltransferase Ste14